MFMYLSLKRKTGDDKKVIISSGVLLKMNLAIF